jgi:hypothetical protein
LDGVSDGPFRVCVHATVRKGIGSYIDYAHDQRALAELQRALTEVPLKDRSHWGDSKGRGTYNGRSGKEMVFS